MVLFIVGVLVALLLVYGSSWAATWTTDAVVDNRAVTEKEVPFAIALLLILPIMLYDAVNRPYFTRVTDALEKEARNGA